MKRTIISIIASLLLLLAAFPGEFMPIKAEMGQLAPALAMGIDAADGGVEVTLLLENINDEGGAGSVNTAEGGEDGGGGASAAGDPVVSATAPTVSLALEAIRRRSSKEVPTGSIQCFLLGEAAARDLAKFTDYIRRDNDLSLTSGVFAVTAPSGGSGTAHDLMAGASDPDWVDALSVFGKNSGTSDLSSELSLTAFMGEMVKPNPCFLIPAVTLDGSSVLLGGYAVASLGQKASVGVETTLSSELAPAAHMLTGRPVRGAWDLTLPDGRIVTVIVENVGLKTDFTFYNQFGVKFTLSVDSNLQDGGGLQKLTAADLAAIEQAADAKIAASVNAVLALEKQYGDFLNIGDALRLRHPYRWNKWGGTINTAQFAVAVNVRIQHAYDTN